MSTEHSNEDCDLVSNKRLTEESAGPSDREIIGAFEPFHQEHERLREELMASLPEVPSLARKAPDEVSPRRLQREWMMRISLSIAFLTAMTATLWLSLGGSDDNVVYGIEGLQERMLKVRSVHMKGWMCHWMYDMQNRRVGEKPIKLPLEHYHERPNRLFMTSYGFMPNKVTRSFIATDGKRQILIRHDSKLAIVGKANPLAAELMVENYFQSEIFGDFLRLPESKYKKVGIENIKRVRAVIYEYDENRINGTGTREKLWINPATGFPVRMETYRTDHKTGVEELSLVYDHIEINVPIMHDQFPLQTPKGYRVQESDFSKKGYMIGSGSDGETTYGMRYGINIDNRAVLTCWMHGWRNPNDNPLPPEEPIFRLDYGGKSQPCDHSLIRVDTIQGRNWHWALLTPKDPKFEIKHEYLHFIVRKGNRTRFSIKNRLLRFSEERLKKIIDRIQRSTLSEDPSSEKVITLEKLREAIAERTGRRL